MKHLFVIVIFLCVSFTLLAQNKEIKGDSTYWHYYNDSKFYETLKLMDFNTTEYKFTFRIKLSGQIIEIWKEQDSIKGLLTNYIYRHHPNKEKKDKLLFDKVTLEDSLVLKAYELIQSSNILNLKSQKEIEGWQQGFDGFVYTIEHSDRENYWFKSYWSPSASKGLKEAELVNSFIREIEAVLDLKQHNLVFSNAKIIHGTYSTGTIRMVTVENHYFNLGYEGTTRLPIGFNVGGYVSRIKNIKFSSGLIINSKFDFNSNYDYSVLVYKNSILTKLTNRGDQLSYQYRERNLNFYKTGKFINNKVECYSYFKKIDWGIGMDLLSHQDKTQMGVVFFSI